MGHSRRPDHHAESELIVLLLVVELAGEHQVHVWVDPLLRGRRETGVGRVPEGCRKGAGSVSLLERGAAGRVRLYQPLEGGLRWRRGGPEGWASESGLGEETRATTRAACETRIGDAAAAVGAAAVVTAAAVAAATGVMSQQKAAKTNGRARAYPFLVNPQRGGVALVTKIPYLWSH